MWPDPELGLQSCIPQDIRECVEEAHRCLFAGSSTASVAMTGRATEAIARHFLTKDNPGNLMLAAGLRKLYEEEVIDQRLYTWGKELHEHRNLAAHASGATFSHVDAQDLFDFAMAICDYVFVLQDKYERFMER
ncbi:MAG: DUF4145 domain-containing protein [Bryobacteraceae bacterium]